MESNIDCGKLKNVIVELGKDYTEFSKGPFKNVCGLIDKFSEISGKEINPHTTMPREHPDEIKSFSETAFQRAISKCHTSELSFASSKKIVKWLEIELPVTFSGSGRRKCVDLIGEVDKKPFICELKFGNNSSTDCPEYGVIELLIYYYWACKNAPDLHNKKVYRVNPPIWSWLDIAKGNGTLILAANKSYWNYWISKRKKLDYYSCNIFELVSRLNKEAGVNICLFEVLDIDFKNQKGSKDHYIPTIKCSEPWVELTL